MFKFVLKTHAKFQVILIIFLSKVEVALENDSKFRCGFIVTSLWVCMPFIYITWYISSVFEQYCLVIFLIFSWRSQNLYLYLFCYWTRTANVSSITWMELKFPKNSTTIHTILFEIKKCLCSKTYYSDFPKQLKITLFSKYLYLIIYELLLYVIRILTIMTFTFITPSVFLDIRLLKTPLLVRTQAFSYFVSLCFVFVCFTRSP